MNINKTSEEIRKAISEKRNTDYCGIYELLSHEKLKKKCFEEHKAKEIDQQNKKFRTLKSYFDIMKNGSGSPSKN